MPTIALLIEGKVQGVYYRASACKEAERLHCRGWVKNTREGHVEALVTATETDLEHFVTWCRRGPAGAIVNKVTVSPAADADFEGFSIVRG